MVILHAMFPFLWPTANLGNVPYIVVYRRRRGQRYRIIYTHLLGQDDFRDAHGEGVLGTGGRGITEHFGLHGQVDIEIGTLSKAFGVIGGYVAGPGMLIDYLKQRGRPFLFSSAGTAVDVAACLAAVDMLQQTPHVVQQLWDNTRFCQAELRALGFDLGRTQTPITPVMVGGAQRAKDFSAALFHAGIFAQALAFPTVPRGTAASA
jgi:glycine C-acetyltransferase